MAYLSQGVGGFVRPRRTSRPRTRQSGIANRYAAPPARAYTAPMTPSRAALATLVQLLRPPRTRLLLAWTFAACVTVLASGIAWFNCYDARRVDGNWGHRNIDFSGQWLLAALFASGEGRHLYDRRAQEPLLERSFPRDREDPQQGKSDARANPRLAHARRRDAAVGAALPAGPRAAVRAAGLAAAAAGVPPHAGS